MRFVGLLIAGLVIALSANAASADTITSFAYRMHMSGRLYHDPGYRGPEVVFRSSGRATQAQAMAAWRRSRPHAALLPRIRTVHCYGNVCVGR